MSILNMNIFHFEFDRNKDQKKEIEQNMPPESADYFVLKSVRT